MQLPLLPELIFVHSANAPETFKQKLAGGIQGLGKPTIEELMIEPLTLLLNQDHAHKIVG